MCVCMCPQTQQNPFNIVYIHMQSHIRTNMHKVNYESMGNSHCNTVIHRLLNFFLFLFLEFQPNSMLRCFIVGIQNCFVYQISRSVKLFFSLLFLKMNVNVHFNFINSIHTAFIKQFCFIFVRYICFYFFFASHLVHQSPTHSVFSLSVV